MFKPSTLMLRRIHRIRSQGAVMHQRVWKLITSPVFIWLTVVFHILVIGAAFLLRYLEHDLNPALKAPINAIYWSFATVTTVGYGDVVPVTSIGKSVAILLMMIGAIFTAIYTALFASTLLASELDHVEQGVRGVQTKFRELEKEVRIDETHVEALLTQLQDAISSLRDQKR